MNLFQFIKETDGFENSLNFAIKLGLLPDPKSKDCIKCGRKEGLRWTKSHRYTKMPFIFVCSKRDCRATLPLGRNTMFDRLNFPLPNAMRLIYFWLMKVSVDDSANQLELTENTVEEWYQFFREVCAFIIINYTEAIGGPGHVIELGEYQLQTKEESYNLWFLTGIDRNTGNNIAVHVEDLECETIWPVIKNYILPGSVVVTPRFKKLVSLETNSGEGNLDFVHPRNYMRGPGDLHLDDMWIDLKQFIEKEMPQNQLNSIELYAYQYLYFKRDIFCNKPTSELILPFLNDVKQVYPGFEKESHLEYKIKQA